MGEDGVSQNEFNMLNVQNALLRLCFQYKVLFSVKGQRSELILQTTLYVWVGKYIEQQQWG